MRTKIGKETYEALDAVAEFHRLNNQLINDGMPKTAVTEKVCILRIRLILEEYAESVVALHEGDLVKFADGLADLMYVLLGTAVSFGSAVPDSFYEGDHLKTLALLDDRHTFMFLRAGGKMINILTEKLYEVSACTCPDEDCDGKVPEMDDHLILQEMLRDTCAMVGATAAEAGIPLREIFFEVHRANLSKKLGGAVDGRKYGEGGGKAAGYIPPDVQGILDRHQKAQKMEPEAPSTASIN